MLLLRLITSSVTKRHIEAQLKFTPQVAQKNYTDAEVIARVL